MRSSLSDPASPSTLNSQGVTVSLILAERVLPSRGNRPLGLRGLDLSGPTHVHLRYGPVNRSPSVSMALSIGFRVSVSLHPAIHATVRLALALAVLAPASPPCLSLDTRSPDPPAA